MFVGFESQWYTVVVGCHIDITLIIFIISKSCTLSLPRFHGKIDGFRLRFLHTNPLNNDIVVDWCVTSFISWSWSTTATGAYLVVQPTATPICSMSGIFITICPNKIIQFCRFLYTSTMGSHMGQVWMMVIYLPTKLGDIFGGIFTNHPIRPPR